MRAPLCVLCKVMDAATHALPDMADALPYVALAVSTGLCTADEARALLVTTGAALLTHRNGWRFLHAGLMSVAQARAFCNAAVLEAVLSRGGCEAVCDGLVTVEELMPLRNARAVRALFSSRHGVRALRERLLHVSELDALPDTPAHTAFLSVASGCAALRAGTLTVRAAAALTVAQLTAVCVAAALQLPVSQMDLCDVHDCVRAGLAGPAVAARVVAQTLGAVASDPRDAYVTVYADAARRDADVADCAAVGAPAAWRWLG